MGVSPLLLWSGIFILFALFLFYLRGVVILFFFSFMFALLLDPVVSWMERALSKLFKSHKKSQLRGVSTIITYLILLVGLYGLITAGGGVFVRETSDFFQKLPNYIQDFVKEFSQNKVWLNWQPLLLSKDASVLGELSKYANLYIGKLLKFVINSLSYAWLLVLTPVVSAFILRDFHTMKASFLYWVPDAYKEDFEHVLEEVLRVARGYIKAELLIFLFGAVYYSVALSLISLPYSLIMGIIAGLLETVPYVGPITSFSVLTVVAFVSGGWEAVFHLIVIYLLYLIIQQFLYPNIFAGTLKLHPLTVIAALFIFGEIFGAFGIIIATPAVAVLRTLLKVWKERMQRKRSGVNAE